MYSGMHVSPTSPSPVDVGHVLRTVGGCGPYAAHRLAAEERYAAAAAATARARFLRESGAEPAGIVARFAALRTRLGSMLIRSGERVTGRPHAAATRMVRGA
jgi:hypothetical protein